MSSSDIKQKYKGKKDFEDKAKRVAGKKTKDASNVTRTAITAKTVKVDSQNLSDNDDPMDLLSQYLKLVVHYQPAARAGAFSDMNLLFLKYPEIFTRNISNLMTPLGEGMIDEEPLVRRSACALLYQNLHLIPAAKVAPFMNLLMSYLTTAASHIDVGIRIDFLHLLRLMMMLYPSLVRETGTALISNFKQLLQDRTRAIHFMASNSIESTNISLPSMVSVLSKMKNSSNSTLRHTARNLGATGMFVKGGNAGFAGQQGGHHSDSVGGIGSMLRYGAAGTANESVDTLSTVADQYRHCLSLPMSAVFGMNSTAHVTNSIKDVNAIHTGLININVGTMSPVEMTLCLLDNLLKLHSSPIEEERLNSILETFRPSHAVEGNVSVYEKSQSEIVEKAVKDLSGEEDNKNKLFSVKDSAQVEEVKSFREVSVTSDGVDMSVITKDPLSSLLNLNSVLNVKNDSGKTVNEKTVILEKISKFSSSIIPELFNCWKENFPPSWRDNESRDLYESADLISSLKQHSDLHNFNSNDYAGRHDKHKREKLSQKEKHDDQKKKAANAEEIDSKVLSRSLSIMNMITSCLLSFARIDLAHHSLKATEDHTVYCPLITYMTDLNKYVFPYFPLSATAVHDVKIVSDINLSIAQLISIIISTNPLDYNPKEFHKSLIKKQQEEFYASERERIMMEKAAMIKTTEEILEEEKATAEMERVSDLMEHFGKSKKTAQKKQSQRKHKERKEKEQEVKRTRILATTQLNSTNAAIFEQYEILYEDVRVLEDSLVEYIHLSFVHHTAQELKYQEKLQRRINKRFEIETDSVSNLSTVSGGLVVEAVNDNVATDGVTDNKKRKRDVDDSESQDSDNDDSNVKKPRTVVPSSSSDPTTTLAANSNTVVDPQTEEETYNFMGIAPLSDLLHIIWTLLPQMPKHLQTWIIESFTNLYSLYSIAPMSPNKLICIPFLAALIHVDGGGHEWKKYGFMRQSWLPSLPQVLKSLLNIINMPTLNKNKNNIFDHISAVSYPKFSLHTTNNITAPLSVCIGYISNIITYVARVYDFASNSFINSNRSNSQSFSLNHASVTKNLSHLQKFTNHVLNQTNVADNNTNVISTQVFFAQDTDNKLWDQLQYEFVNMIANVVPVELSLDSVDQYKNKATLNSPIQSINPSPNTIVVFKPTGIFHHLASETTQANLLKAISYSSTLSTSMLDTLAFACRYSHPQSDNEADFYSLPPALSTNVRCNIVQIVAAADDRLPSSVLMRFFMSCIFATNDITVSDYINSHLIKDYIQVNPDLNSTSQSSHPSVVSTVISCINNLSLNIACLENNGVEPKMDSNNNQIPVTIRDTPVLTGHEKRGLVLKTLSPILTRYLKQFLSILIDVELPKLYLDPQYDITSTPAFVNIARVIVLYEQCIYQGDADIPLETSFLSILGQAIATWLPLVVPYTNTFSQQKVQTLTNVTYSPQPEAIATSLHLLASIPTLFNSVMGYWLYYTTSYGTSLYNLSHAAMNNVLPVVKLNATHNIVPIRGVVVSILLLSQFDAFKSSFRYDEQICPVPIQWKLLHLVAPDADDGFPTGLTKYEPGTVSDVLSHLCRVLYTLNNNIAIVRGKVDTMSDGDGEVNAVVNTLLTQFPDEETISQFHFSVISLLNKDPLNE